MKDNYIVKDGKTIKLNFSKEIDRTKVSSKKLTDSYNDSDDSDPYDPVYVCTGKVTFGDVVSTVSDGVWLVTTALTFGATGITSKAIEKALVKGAGYAGAASFINKYFDGYVKYDEYRTSGTFYTNYSGYQYKFRTQNYRVGGNIGSNTLSETTINSSPSSWYFGSRDN